MWLQNVFKVLYLLWIVTEILVLLITRTRSGEGDVQDRGSLRVLWGVILCSIFAGMAIGAAVPRTAIHGAPWFGPLTVALLALGLCIRWCAIYTLGSSFSANVAIHATQTLQRSGLFRLMRHPSYTGILLVLLAMGMSTHNWLALAIIVLPPVAALLYRIRVEEAALTRAFGQAYLDYSRTTKRLIPGIY